MFCTMGINNPMDQPGLGSDWLESCFEEQDLGILVGNKLTVSQQRGCVAKQVWSILGCVRKRIARRLREVILPL